jgi:hypothetical protein
VAGGRGNDLDPCAVNEAKRNAVQRSAVREQRASSSSGRAIRRWSRTRDGRQRACDPRPREGPPSWCRRRSRPGRVRARDGSPSGARREAARCEARQPGPAQRGRAPDAPFPIMYSTTLMRSRGIHPARDSGAKLQFVSGDGITLRTRTIRTCDVREGAVAVRSERVEMGWVLGSATRRGVSPQNTSPTTRVASKCHHVGS